MTGRLSDQCANVRIRRINRRRPLQHFDRAFGIATHDKNFGEPSERFLPLRRDPGRLKEHGLCSQWVALFKPRPRLNDHEVWVVWKKVEARRRHLEHVGRPPHGQKCLRKRARIFALRVAPKTQEPSVQRGTG